MDKLDKVQSQVPIFGFDSAVANLEKGLMLADTIMKSGLVPSGLDNKYKVFAVLLKGKELNIPPMQALQSMYVIGGRVAMEAQMMLALIYRCGELEHIKFDEGDDWYQVTMNRKGFDNPFVYKFTMQDAERMQTNEKGRQIPLSQKFNWRTMPKVMLRWRAISNCARIAFPDIVSGLYTPEELGATVVNTDDGGYAVEIPFDEEMEYERMQNQLRKFEKSGTKEEFETWIEINRADLEKLSEKKLSILRPIISGFYKKFNITKPLDPSSNQGVTDEQTSSNG